MAKHRRSRYEAGRRSSSWLKLKVRPTQELVVGGFVPGQGGHRDLGALVVGVMEDGRLRYAGRVGSGIDTATRARLRAALDGLARPEHPFADAPADLAGTPGAAWADPILVIRAEIAGWTRDGIVRQATFVAEAPEVDPADVERQEAVGPEAAARALAKAGVGRTKAAGTSHPVNKPNGSPLSKDETGALVPGRSVGAGTRRACSSRRVAVVRRHAAPFRSSCRSNRRPRRSSPPWTPCRGAEARGGSAAATWPSRTSTRCSRRGARRRIRRRASDVRPGAETPRTDGLPRRGARDQARPRALLRAGGARSCCPTSPGGRSTWRATRTASTATSSGRRTWRRGRRTGSTRWREPDPPDRKPHAYVLADGLATLAWLGNQAAVELHPWTSPIDAPAEPRWALIDIDPGQRTTWEETLVLARLYRRALEHLGVAGVPKVTGKRGVQVFIPLRPGYTFEETRDWIEQVSRAVGGAVPDLVSWEWSKDRRDGRARLDFTQNWRNRTLVGPYSPRPAAGLPVSAPIKWDELDDPDLRPDRWTIRTILARIAERGDLFAPALGPGQELPRL